MKHKEFAIWACSSILRASYGERAAKILKNFLKLKA